MKNSPKRPWSIGTVISLGLILVVIAGCIYVFPKLSSGNSIDLGVMVQQISENSQVNKQ